MADLDTMRMLGAPMIDDPDETEGRRLYRAQADKLAAGQMAMAGRSILYKYDAVCGRCGTEHLSGACEGGPRCVCKCRKCSAPMKCMPVARRSALSAHP